MDSFGNGPSEYDFRRKISDSPRAVARFRSTWEAFGTFLRDSGILDDGGGTVMTETTLESPLAPLALTARTRK